MESEDPGPTLVGRRQESEILDELLVDIRARRSRVLVLRGEAGIGKTVLLDQVATTSRGVRGVRAAGLETEMELAFAGVHLLCLTLLDHMADLPTPQRAALATAFGLADGPPADRFLVGLAVLNLLSMAAEDQPLVCLVDDAQWLDSVSLQTLVFVAHRLLAEAAGVVFVVREPSEPLPLDGLPDRMISGLRNREARTLLDRVSPGRLDAQVRDRIVAEARGNPLALLELPRSFTAAEMAGGYALPAARPVRGHVEQQFVERVRALPEPTRRLVVLAAAEPLGDGALLWRAASGLGIDADAGGPATDAGLIEFGPQVRFRHPLVRSAAYRAGSATDRQDAHRALADATDPLRDPDRRAWHRAHATSVPDDEVAADLQRSARRALARGGIAAAAAFLEQATALTADPAGRAARALTAAQAKFDAAAFEAADALLDTAEIGPLDELQQARLLRLRAQIVVAHRRGRDDPPLLLDAARHLEGLDDGLARETYLEALGAAIFAGSLSRPSLREVADLASRAPAPATPPRTLDHLLDAVAARFSMGYAAAAPGLRQAVEAFRGDLRYGRADSTRWFWLAWQIALDLWDDGLQDELATAAVRQARATGALEQLPLALVYRAHGHVYAGEFAAASALIDESEVITAAMGKPPLGSALALLVAWRGRESEHEELYRWAMPDAMSRGEGRAVAQHGHLMAVLGNALGRYDEALVGARRACEHDDLGVKGFALAELIEAAVHVGADDEATVAVHELEERALASGTDWALGLLARSRALLSRGGAAEAQHLEAIERLERTRAVGFLARAHLQYGEWLRRNGRRSDARAQLRIAHELLAGMGAEGFAQRARRELRATGDSAPARTGPKRGALTPQEAQIAALAAEGRTNPEIGSELFISPRTVEYHLSKVFTKLGLTSRRQLRSATVQLDR